VNVEVKVTPRPTDAIVTSWHILRVRPVLLTVALVFFVVLPWLVAVAVLRFGLAIHTIIQMALTPFAVIFAFGVGLLFWDTLCPSDDSRPGASSTESPRRASRLQALAGNAPFGGPWSWTPTSGGARLRAGTVAILRLPARCATPELVGWIRAQVERAARSR
jgi:hypothetical protein